MFCMHACTLGRPTDSMQAPRACSRVSAPAADGASKPPIAKANADVIRALLGKNFAGQTRLESGEIDIASSLPDGTSSYCSVHSSKARPLLQTDTRNTPQEFADEAPSTNRRGVFFLINSCPRRTDRGTSQQPHNVATPHVALPNRAQSKHQAPLPR